MDSQLGERQDFIKRFEDMVNEVKGKQLKTDEEVLVCQEQDKQTDLRVNGLNIMIESIHFEIEQMKRKQKDYRAHMQVEMDTMKKEITNAAKGIRAAGVVKQKLKEQIEAEEKAAQEQKEAAASSAEVAKMTETIKEIEKKLEEIQKKAFERDLKINDAEARLSKLEDLRKEQDKRDTKQETKINTLDDRLTHFEITL